MRNDDEAGPRGRSAAGVLARTTVAAMLLAGCGTTGPGVSPVGLATSPAGVASPSAVASGAPSARPTEDASVSDGEPWIVFQAAAGSGDGIFLVQPDGTGRHRFAIGTGSQIHPDWSPDGRQIAYATITPADRTELWVVNADDTDARRLFSCDLPCNQVSYPDWAPDGRSIYFAVDADAPPDAPPTIFRFARYDLATGKTTIVLERKGSVSAEQPRISPDGTRVVYSRFREGGPDGAGSAIFVADLKGGPEHRLTEWEKFGAHPDWSVKDLIVFNTFDLGVFQDTTAAANLYTIAVDGTDLTQLTTFGVAGTRATQPRWTPDGTRIVFTRVDGEGFGTRRLAVINPDGSGLGSLTPSPITGTHWQLRPLPG